MVWRASLLVAVFWGACGRPLLIGGVEPEAVAGGLLSAKSGHSASTVITRQKGLEYAVRKSLAEIVILL